MAVHLLKIQHVCLKKTKICLYSSDWKTPAHRQYTATSCIFFSISGGQRGTQVMWLGLVAYAKVSKANLSKHVSVDLEHDTHTTPKPIRSNICRKNARVCQIT